VGTETTTPMSTLILRQKLIEIAKSEVGVTETPRNSNTGTRVLEYQRATNLEGTGWPYCAAFVCWCIREWGQLPEVRDALKMTVEEFASWRPKTAAAYGFHEWAEKRNLTVFDENSNPGEAILHAADIVTFDFSHIGLVENDQGNVLLTVEGNTDASGSREGGGVYAKTRPRSLARKFIRLLA
jgi:hypothetical protein